MYSLKFILILLLGFKRIESFADGLGQNVSECLIHNHKYKYEYLLPNDSNNVFTYSLLKVNDFNNLKWILTSNENGSFYIKSFTTNKALCSTANLTGIFEQKRILKLKTIDQTATMSTNLNECLWSFKSLNKQNRLFLIRNSKYGEMLFTTSKMFNKNSKARNVFTWHGKLRLEFLFNIFSWTVDCQKGLFLLS